jgi:hypothetical protein
VARQLVSWREHSLASSGRPGETEEPRAAVINGPQASNLRLFFFAGDEVGAPHAPQTFDFNEAINAFVGCKLA